MRHFWAKRKQTAHTSYGNPHPHLSKRPHHMGNRPATQADIKAQLFQCYTTSLFLSKSASLPSVRRRKVTFIEQQRS